METLPSIDSHYNNYLPKFQHLNFPCKRCRETKPLDLDISFAFQPIVSASQRTIFSYEALVRGANGESASSIFKYVSDDNIYQFDQNCRVQAIQKAAQLNLKTKLNLNFTPNAIYEPERCIQTTLRAAKAFNFPIENIIFEVTESEEVKDRAHLTNIMKAYRSLGFETAIDDFGAGYSGLNLLTQYQPNYIKLDIDLITDIHLHKARQVIVKGVLMVCEELGITVLAEGVEKYDEYIWLREQGVDLFQGFYFAKPVFECLVGVDSNLF